MSEEFICCNKKMRHTSLGYYECEYCKKQISDELGLIKKTLDENPGLNALELAQKTGLSNSIILKYLNDGTLSPIKTEKKKIGYYVHKEVVPVWHTKRQD